MLSVSLIPKSITISGGRCEEQDVLTPAMREWMIGRVHLAINETSGYFRVRRRSAPLQFEHAGCEEGGDDVRLRSPRPATGVGCNT